MKPSLPFALLAAALAALPTSAQDPAASQAPPGVTDWRMPFRSPQTNLVPPEAMWAHLRPMYEIARDVPPELKRFDEDGVEIVEDPSWQRHRDALRSMAYDAGYVSLVIRECRHVADRAIAFYGMLYVPDTATAFQMIEHIPGEPVRALREDAYVRAVAYLRAHLPARVPGNLDEWLSTRPGPAGEPAPNPGKFTESLDPSPFVALLSLDDAHDHEQVLWFFARCAEIRPELGKLILEMGKDPIRAILANGTARSRKAAHDFVAILDPVGDRSSLADDAGPSELVAWYEAVLHDVLPPFRRVSDGLVDLYPSSDLDAVVAVGRDGLRDGSIVTANVTGRTKAGAPFRGARIEKLPTPLDRLGLEVGWTLTALDGTPIADGPTIVRMLERAAPNRRRFMVEFVDHAGEARAIEYRRR